jgi:hypothetical protein
MPRIKSVVFADDEMEKLTIRKRRIKCDDDSSGCPRGSICKRETNNCISRNTKEGTRLSKLEKPRKAKSQADCEASELYNHLDNRCYHKKTSKGRETRRLLGTCREKEFFDLENERCVKRSSPRGKEIIEKIKKVKTRFKPHPEDELDISMFKFPNAGEYYKGVGTGKDKGNNTRMLKYVLNKHGNVCKKHIRLSWTKKTSGVFSFKYSKNIFETLFADCIESRFVAVDLGLHADGANHSNFIVYDRLTNTMERYDPMGAMVILSYSFTKYNMHLLDKAIKELFVDTFEIKYIPPNEVCPFFGPQFFQARQGRSFLENKPEDQRGACAVWSTLLLDLKLTYPDIPTDELINKFINTLRHKEIDISRFITNYAVNAYKKAKKLGY